MQAATPVSLLHEPLLLNLLAHAAGTLIFGIFLVLLWRDRAGQKLRGGRLSLLSAALAFVWNAGSIVAIAIPLTRPILMLVLAAALSLLPACLLDLLLAGRLRGLVRAGYALSLVAILLHALEPVLDLSALRSSGLRASDLHRLTLVVTSIGFAVLTGIAGVALLTGARAESRALVTRTVAAMALFLFALSFAHFQPAAGHGGWPAELAIHHAGLPVALFLLMQDYRFLLLDAFLRFLANILLAAGFTWALLLAGWLHMQNVEPRDAALTLLGVCGGLIFYALARESLQVGLTRLLFRREPLEPVLLRLRELAYSEEDAWRTMAASIAGSFFGADARIGPVNGEDENALGGVNVRVNADEQLILGRRAGGRRYLSEDLDALAAMASQLRAGLGQYREMDLKRLVSEAELKALQSQIHPHFLFNVLNTLYGLIPREARAARETVLNLSDMLRHFLRVGETLIPLEEELRVVRAYLEIEGQRLGSKLKVLIETEPAALLAKVPALSIQPLVENAVQHAISPNPEGGRLHVTVRVNGAAVDISVVDSGGTFSPESRSPHGLGLGLQNVRRRLKLHFGEGSEVSVDTTNGETRVRFSVPLSSPSKEPREAAAK